MSDVRQDQEEDAVLQAPTLFKGKDLTKVPCMRGTVVYGAGAGIVTACITFLRTSSITKAMNSSVYGYAGFSLCYWFYCRHRLAVEKFRGQMIQEALESYREKMGTTPSSSSNKD